MDKVDILGVRVDLINIDQAVEKVESWLKKGGKHYIVTPNPEFIMLAQKDLEFKNILNNADLAIPDGNGLKLLSRVRQFDIVPGVDLTERLCKLSSEKSFTVGFLGGRNFVAEKAAERLQKKYKDLKVVFAASGPEVDEKGKEIYDLKSLFINFKSCDLLFVAFGQGKQEKWIAKNLNKLPIKVMMGVGGSFDYIAGIVPRAPKLLRSLGLEWLFRLLLQPWRIKRQLILLKYMWIVLTNKSKG